MKRKIKMIALFILTFLIVLVFSGFIYETTSYKSVKDNYPPDGQMIEVGDRELHMNVEGTSTKLPPVVIETGTGNWSYDWSNVQKELSKQTQVITYDCAGYGWSDPPNEGFSLDETFSDLNAVLEEARTDIPVIIVAHSVGGVYARHFINQHPDKVAGLIFVDARNEFFKDDSTEEYNDAFFASQDQRMNKVLARLGAVRLFGEKTLEGMPKFISKEKYANVQYDEIGRASCRERVKRSEDDGAEKKRERMEQ